GRRERFSRKALLGCRAAEDGPANARRRFRMKAFRWNPTQALWRRYLEATPPIPQMDRWLAREFKQNPRFGKQDRAWYSEALFAGARFGLLAGFVNALSRAGDAADWDALRAELTT